jgi:hypothetical protein
MTNRRPATLAAACAALLAGAALRTPQMAGAAAAKAPAPIVNTGYADALSASGATLRGSVSPKGSVVDYYFEYGATQAYGSLTATAPLGGGGTTIHVSARVAGLSAYTTYHFRLVAVGPAGTTDGADRSFTTSKIPLSVTIAAAPNPSLFGSSFVVSGSLSGTGNADHPVALQGDPFPFLGGFRDIAAPALTNGAGAFSFVLAGLSQNTRLRVVASGSPTAYSRVIDELIAVRVSFHARPTGRRGFVRLYGAIAPAVLGAHVAFQWIKASGAALNVAGTTTRRGTAGAARFGRVLRIRHRGLYRVFVAVANGRQVSGSSRVIAIR